LPTTPAAILRGVSDVKKGPFAALEALRDRLPSQPESTEPPKPKGPARAVIRIERKQRGGKEVTVVDHLGLPARELELWCRALKQALGCGGSVENGLIVLQGDLRTRLPDLLTKHGVVKVTVG
jgi:translation initiation factor 1